MAGRDVEQYHQDVFGRVGDIIGNVTVVQSYTRFLAETSALRALMADLLRAQYPVLTWWAMLTVLTRTAATITMVAVFAIGAVLAQRGEVTVGQIVAFICFSNLLISKLDMLSGFVGRIFLQVPTLANFFDLLDTSGSTIEKPGACRSARRRARPIRRCHLQIFLHAAGCVQPELRGSPGRDDRPCRPYRLRKNHHLGPAPAPARSAGRQNPNRRDGHPRRDPHLPSPIDCGRFSGCGPLQQIDCRKHPHRTPTATQEEVETAAKLAEAHDFILSKAGGYQFVIGERGSALSGGERQRIAIARAILKNAPILILDEATSALDNETEAKIKLALEAVRRGRTTFLIAHRLSTVANANQIIVLDHGRIVEAGTFHRLAEAGGLFERLVKAGSFEEGCTQEPSARAAE